MLKSNIEELVNLNIWQTFTIYFGCVTRPHTCILSLFGLFVCIVISTKAFRTCILCVSVLRESQLISIISVRKSLNSKVKICIDLN